MEKNVKKIKIKKQVASSSIKEVAKTKLALAQFTDAPIVWDMDDVPDDLEERKFPVLNRNEQTGAPKKLVGFPLENVSVMYFGNSSLFDKYIERERQIRLHGATEDQIKVKQHVLSNTGSDRGQETRSVLAIYFRFVADIINPSIVDIRHLLDTRVALAFPRWYKATGKKPSTISNVIKIIHMFLKYLHGLEAFANYRARINAVDDVLRVPAAKAKDIAKSTANKTVAETLMLLGEWLDKKELYQLNESVFNKITLMIERDKSFIYGNAHESKLSRDEMTLFMGHLYLLTLMHLGGQRRQFGASLTKQNVVFEGGEAKFFPPREKVKRAKTDFFVLPMSFSIPLRVWIETYLPIVANKGVESVWVNKNGNAMRYQGLSKLVSRIVAVYFPGRTISCTYFRRALVTFLTKHHLKLNQEGIAQFFSAKHAALINTSPDVLATHYDRVHRSDVNKNTLETVNSTVGMQPTESMAKMLDAFQKKFDKKNDDFADSIVRIVDLRFVTRSKVEFTVAFKDGSRKDFPGYRMIPFMNLVSNYWASIGGRTCSGTPPKKSSKSRIKKEEKSKEEEDEDKDEDDDEDSDEDQDEEDSWSSFEARTSSSSDNDESDEESSSLSNSSSSSSSLSSNSKSVIKLIIY